MSDEKTIFTKVEGRSCDRLYAFAKNLEERCDACGALAGDHQTPMSLRGVMAMLDAEYKRGIEDAAVLIENKRRAATPEARFYYQSCVEDLRALKLK